MLKKTCWWVDDDGKQQKVLEVDEKIDQKTRHASQPDPIWLRIFSGHSVEHLCKIGFLYVQEGSIRDCYASKLLRYDLNPLFKTEIFVTTPTVHSVQILDVNGAILLKQVKAFIIYSLLIVYCNRNLQLQIEKLN